MRVQERSGRQLQIRANGYEATIATVGATLRQLQHNERDLIVPFDADELRPHSRGATLAPWPNRIANGAYTFNGSEYQLPLSEPARNNAIHGLVSWVDFQERVVVADRIVLTTIIAPMPGYPFRVEVEVEYTIDASGLTQTVTGRNLGADPAPWGTAPHPYLKAGTATPAPGAGAVDEWILRLPASEVLTVDERLLPVAVESIDAHPAWDFREPRKIGTTFLDYAFTGLTRDSDLATVEVRTTDGSGVGIAFDEGLPWVQIHTADNPNKPASHRAGLAVEPMTCPPDAFNSGTDLIIIEPGEEHAASWRIFTL
ncbi:aldose 1-epimerase family protein [Microbacterium sp. YY-01]|uniref:aldose 1-epimerase family protein n=1 Tax=Microbacterium sp. YY-01 TaxID=3421634 RepID=UPI003D184CE1